MDSLDVIDGSAGNDTLELGGPNYAVAGGLIHETSLEGLIVDAGFNYNFVIANAVVDAGATFTFDASALGSGNTATFDASDDTDSHFYLIGGAGDDSLTARGGNTFDLTLGGNDTAVAFGAGTFLLGNQLSAGDFVQGNIGSTVVMGGAFTAGTTLGISTANFDGIANFHFDATTGVTGVVFSGAIPNTGEVMALDASAMGTTAVSFDFSGAIAASFSITGSGGNDTITLSGSGANSVTAGLGADTITCGTAVDTIITGAVADSSGAGAYDTISGFNFDADQFNLAGAHSVSGFAATAATVSAATFDADIFAASAGHMAGDGALSITAILGDLTGHTFLVVDVNNDGIYVAGTDYVFDITGFTGTPDAGDFI